MLSTPVCSLRLHALVGVNVTEMLQLAPAATDVSQSFVCMNGPLVVIDWMFTAS